MVQENFSLLPYNTFGIDVKAACFLEYCSIDELRDFIDHRLITSPFLHIGGGSNLLFMADYPGVILHSCIGGVDVIEQTDQEVFVRVGAGVSWDAFVAYCVESGWYGVENLSLIPGEVGASAVQNIGAYGVEVKELITSVETINLRGELQTYRVDECDYSYRNSRFKQADMKDVFITYVCFRLSKKEHYTLHYGTVRQEAERHSQLSLPLMRRIIIDIRRAKLPDPKVEGNVGSFFVNPIVSHARFEALQAQHPGMPFYELADGQVKIPAGWMIEQCGWKGKALGPVAVYDKQALVFVNRGGAKGSDVLALSNAVKNSVREMFGIEICPEVSFV